jgi:hypothetical protein
LRIETSLVNPPQRVKIALLKLSDAKPHAAIVAGERRAAGYELRVNKKVFARGSKPAASAGAGGLFLDPLFSSARPLRSCIYKKYDFWQGALWGV